MPAHILLIESSTEMCSVGISTDDILWVLKESSEPNVHTGQMTVMIREVLNETGLMPQSLDAVAVSDGPGSYTSLRVGLSVAKGLCYTLQKPLITIGSLEILAYGVAQSWMSEGSLIIPMIDARRNEVYAAVYNEMYEEIQPVSSIVLDQNWFENLPHEESKIIICGNGAKKASTQFKDKKYRYAHHATSASFIAAPAFRKFKKAEFSDIAYHTPYYHKAPNITQSAKKFF